MNTFSFFFTSEAIPRALLIKSPLFRKISATAPCIKNKNIVPYSFQKWNRRKETADKDII